jgi:hypothetical protein
MKMQMKLSLFSQAILLRGIHHKLFVTSIISFSLAPCSILAATISHKCIWSLGLLTNRLLWAFFFPLFFGFSVKKYELRNANEIETEIKVFFSTTRKQNKKKSFQFLAEDFNLILHKHSNFELFLRLKN